MVRFIAADRFTEHLFIANNIQNIVNYLEGKPKLPAIFNQRLALCLARPAEIASGNDSTPQQSPRLAVVDILQLGKRERLPFLHHVNLLPGDHAKHTCLLREIAHGSHQSCRLGGNGKQLRKAMRQQTVTRQNRRGFVKRLMTAGATAPQIVVIHSGQIIVNQRIGVQHFDSAGKRQIFRQGLLVHAGKALQGSQKQHRAQAFPARQQAVIHRLKKPLRPRARRSKATRQGTLHHIPPRGNILLNLL